MPYGLSKDKGGDSPARTAKMESCVQQVMKQGKSKAQAIAICKSSLDGKRKRRD